MFNRIKNDKVISAVVLAAGSGKRMGLDVKKQFIEINGKPLIYYTLRKISEVAEIGKIILVTSMEDIVYMQDIVNAFSLNKVSKIVPGGKERMDSVYNGLKETEDSDYVLIHDGARPFVKAEDVRRVITDGMNFGAAALGVKVKDTIKEVTDENIVSKTHNRNFLYSIQTPQVIKRELLLKGFENARGKLFTDDVGIVENMGMKVKITEGSYSNIKITTKEDLMFAKALLEGDD